MRASIIRVREQDYPEDPAMARLIAAEEAPFRTRLGAVVATTETPLMRYDVLESNMDDVIADVVREATHTDVAFTNGNLFHRGARGSHP